MRSFALVIVTGIVSSAFHICILAQKPVATDKRESAPGVVLVSRSIDLGRIEALHGLPESTVVGYPLHCSTTGNTFFEVYGQADKPGVSYFPDIYRISDHGEVTKIAVPSPQDYKQIVAMGLFASEQRLIVLAQVGQPKDPNAHWNKDEKLFFLVTVAQDGSDQKLIKLALPFDPMKAAVFNSGEILILGMDPINLAPVLALLHSDGSVNRILDMDFGGLGPSAGSKGIVAVKPGDSNSAALQRQMLGNLRTAQFVPWGAEILLVQPGTKQPVFRIKDSGISTAVSIHIPDSSLMESILGSGEKDTWVVRTDSEGSMAKVANGGVAENSPQELFEANPFTGEIIDRLDVRGPQPGEVSCAANHTLSAIYYGLPSKPDVPDQLTYASSLR